MTKVLLFSTLFPNAAQPNHGVFVENRLRKTLELGGVEAIVVAPVPYFPNGHPAFGRYAVFARAPRQEVRHGVEIFHPRYLVVPKFGAWTPHLLYRAALAEVRRLLARGATFDVIDAHYYYPDGVAAAYLARKLKLPLVITGRGTDLTLIPRDPGPRAQIQFAMRQASAMVAVCEDLRRKLLELGADEARTLTLRNGVDLELFRPPADRAAARAGLGLTGFTLASVGGLIPRKGHHLAIEALARLADCTLLIAGGGPMRAQLEAQVQRLGLAGRVRFLGEVPHDRLAEIYGAADALMLASEREGWANVLLEAMACGAPVVATDVNGTREVVCAPAAGRLVAARTVEALVEGVESLRRSLPERTETRRYAEQFDWLRIAKANKALLSGAAEAGYEARSTVNPTPAAALYLRGAEPEMHHAARGPLETAR